MLLNTKINKHWLNNAQASGVDLFALSTIYFDLHLVDQVGLVLINPDREIPAPCVCLEYAEPARFSRTAKHFFDNLNIGIASRAVCAEQAALLQLNEQKTPRLPSGDSPVLCMRGWADFGLELFVS
jgi:hypothetical protein